MPNLTLTTIGPAVAVAVDESDVRDWVALLKPRVMTLVVFTGAVGMIVAPGHLNPVLAIAAILAITVAAGASGAINMWYDRDIDAVMRRTRNRPIPAGRIQPDAALAFGVLLAGAFPPLIGWAAVTGSVSLMPLVMFAIVFMWTPPHFWALSLFAHADYKRAGVPMLPVVAGAWTTRVHVALYTVLLVPLTLAPWALGLSGPAYAVVAAALGVGFLYHAWRVLRDRQDSAGVSLTNDAPAKAAFKYSIIYLFALFGALAVDRLLG
jgi:protoheme IX farnesyltransferase